MKKDNDEVLAGKIAYVPVQACTPSGVPAYMLTAGPFFFIQTPKAVLIIEPDEGQARRIYERTAFQGSETVLVRESVGHYEDDTLVVDTIGLNGKNFLDLYRTPHSEKLHVVERFNSSTAARGWKSSPRSKIRTPSFNLGRRCCVLSASRRPDTRRFAAKAISRSSITESRSTKPRISERRCRRSESRLPLCRRLKRPAGEVCFPHPAILMAKADVAPIGLGRLGLDPELPLARRRSYRGRAAMVLSTPRGGSIRTVL